MADTTGREAPAVRRAVAADAAALTRLRAQMLGDMGLLTEGSDPRWRDSAEAWFTRRLAGAADFAAFVIDDPEHGVVSCAVGFCDDHAPSPGSPSGLSGYVLNMSTDPRFRRRGHARACLEVLLAWFRDETEARSVGLMASEDGLALYRALGFTEPGHAFLQLRLG
jgi:GNAT superfamily N-acetyltransferase